MSTFLSTSGNYDITVGAGTGTLTITGDLSVTGNANLSGNIVADKIVSGTSNIAIPAANGNITVGVGGTSNIVVFTSAGVSITGNVLTNIVSSNGILTTGNLSGGNIETLGNLTVYGNANINALYTEPSTSGNVKYLIFTPFTAAAGQPQSSANITATGSGNLTAAATISGNTIIATSTGGSSFAYKTQTAYNVVKNTSVTIDNLSRRVNSANSIPAITAAAGFINVFYAATVAVSGNAVAQAFNNTGANVTAATYLNIGTTAFGNAGDTMIATVQDQDLGRVYRATFVQTANAANAAITVERIM